jgi:Flp pilus assembly protein TadB
MSPELGAGVVAALSEGQRTIAHLVVLLAVPVVVGVVLLVRRARRRRHTNEAQRFPEER